MTDFDFGKTFSFLFLSLGPFKVIGPFAAVQRWRALIFGAAAVALASACALKVPQQSASLTAIEATDVTAGELQMRIYEAGRRFSSIIEATADTIAARSPDPTIRHNALNWKIAAIPLIEEASLRPDPVVAAVDLWGFSMQLADYVERGDGRDAFGDLESLAIAATDTLERLMRDISTRVAGAGKTAPSGQSLRTWAEQHPLRGSDLRRESVLSSNLKALSMTETSLTGTIAGLQRNLIGVNNRLGYLNEGVFKRVLWQSQLATADLVPQLLQSGRTALMHDLSDQQRQLMGELDKQRLATLSMVSAERAIVLDRVSGERGAVLEGIRQEREAALAALRDERVAVLDRIRAERVGALASMDSIAQHSIDHAGAVVGRLLLWTVLALVVLATFVGLGAVWVARSWRAAGARGG